MKKNFLKSFDDKHANSAVWQFIKFNMVSMSITLVQLLLANALPLFFDSLTVKLPVFLRGIFNPEVLFEGPSKYVTDGAVTWGYVLPFFLSNMIANIYGYFVNMKATFRGQGKKNSLKIYIVVMVCLILFSTWLQGYVVSLLSDTRFASLSRTVAAMAAGTVQMLVLFPLEKFVLFKRR